MASKDERTPGTVPGAEVKSDGPRPGLDGSPPLSAEGAPRRADSPAAMMEQLKREILAEIRGDKGKDVEAELKAAAKRSQERQAEVDRRAADRMKALATYKAKGEAGKAAGEINLEVGKGRRLVFGGEVFRSADPPGSWMEPVDALAKQRVDEEAERRERIKLAAERNNLAAEGLRAAGEALDQARRNTSLRAADARDFRAGSGG